MPAFSSSPEPTNPATDNKRGVEDVVSGAKTGAVVFGSAFGSVPSVNATVLLPDGTAAGLTVIIHTVTAAGFSWRLSAPAPAAGYKLHWHAIV